jgi:hypothetical protein
VTAPTPVARRSRPSRTAPGSVEVELEVEVSLPVESTVVVVLVVANQP